MNNGELVIHLYWRSLTYNKNGEKLTYNLIVDYANRCYTYYANAFYGYTANNSLELKAKSDLEDYKEGLKRAGFREEKKRG